MIESFDEDIGLYYRFRPGHDPVVFVHGISGSSSAWLPIEDLIDKNISFVSVDVRGHGKSRKYADYESYSLEAMANDIRALLDRLQLPAYTLVAHSFGTLVALKLIRLDSRVTRFVAVSPVYEQNHAWWESVAKMLIFAMKIFGPYIPFDTRPRFQLDYTQYRPAGDWTPRRIWADLRATSLRAYLFSLGHIFSSDTDQEWRALKIPVDILQGAHDSIVSVRVIEKLAASLPQSTLTVLPDDNHVIPVNNPTAVAQHLMPH